MPESRAEWNPSTELERDCMPAIYSTNWLNQDLGREAATQCSQELRKLDITRFSLNPTRYPRVGQEV